MNEIVEKMYAQKVANSQTRVRIGVGVIICNSEGLILLEKRSDCGWWGLPGGRIEPGETIQEAAIREVYEETGLTIAITQLQGVYSEPSERIVTFLDNGDIVHLIDVIIRAKVIAGELTCSWESQALQFFHPFDLPVELVPPAKAPLEDFIQNCHGMIR